MGLTRMELARVGYFTAWFSLLTFLIKQGSRPQDTTPEQLLTLLILAYLAAWAPFALLSGRGPADRVRRFAACTLSILGVVVFFEVPAILGLLDYRSILAVPSPPWRREGNRPDAELIYVRQENLRRTLRFTGSDLGSLASNRRQSLYQCTLELDGQGFRNPPGLHAAEIVVLGDSFVEGLHVEEDELVSAQLARLTGSTVANLGRTGYGPQQELQVLSRHGTALGPRICLWLFYEGNDLQDLASHEKDRDLVARSLNDSWTKIAYGRSLTRNVMACALNRWIHPAKRLAAEPFTGRFCDASGRDVEYLFSFGVHEGDPGRVATRFESHQRDAMGRVLKAAHATCRARAIDLVLVFVPAKFRVYRGLCRFPSDSPCPTWPVDDLPENLRMLADSVSREIGFLDLTPRMQSEAHAGRVVYLPDDSHWSGAGHRVAAGEIARFLESRAREPVARSREGRHPGALTSPDSAAPPAD